MAGLLILCIVLIDFSASKPSLNSFNKSYIIMADSLSNIFVELNLSVSY